MVINWGSDRGSFISGRSVHNLGCERLWADFNRVRSALYKDLFDFLVWCGTLDSLDELHMLALQYVYIPWINASQHEFISQWNYHGIRTVGHQTPLAVWYTGLLTAPQQESRVTNWQTWNCYIPRLLLNKTSTVIGWFLIMCSWSNSNVSQLGYNSHMLSGRWIQQDVCLFLPHDCLGESLNL